MKPSISVVSSLGAVTLVLAGAASAVTPGLSGDKSPFGASTPVFDQWSVTNGTIDAAGCDTLNTGFSCGDALKDNGFFSRIITDTVTGEMYFQTIVTEYDVTGAQATLDDDLGFSDENFVSGSNNSGILDKQRLTQNELVIDEWLSPAGESRFENFTEIGTGWAGDYLVLTQTIADQNANTTLFNDFQTDFVFHQDGYSDDPDRGVGMKITQYVPLGQQNVASAHDSQDFVLVDMRGSYVPHSGSVFVASNEFDYQNQLAGGTVSWGSGDRIYATWIGQDFSAAVGQQFGFVAYDNLTSAANDRIQTFTLASSWHQDVSDDTGGDMNVVPGVHTDENGVVVSATWDSSFWGNLATSGSLGGWGTNNISISPPFPKSHPLDP